LFPPDKDFFEYVENDLKHIASDLSGFLNVYYPMLKSTWMPKEESDFILGWMIGTKEQEYSMFYYTKYKRKMGERALFELHKCINAQKEQLKSAVAIYLEKKENSSNSS